MQKISFNFDKYHEVNRFLLNIAKNTQLHSLKHSTIQPKNKSDVVHPTHVTNGGFV